MGSKIVVISDSHGNRDIVNRIIKHEIPFDYIVHCGDGAGDLFFAEIPEGVHVLKVSGNVDQYMNYDMERIEIFDVESFRMMVVHGDQFRVQDDFASMIAEAGRRKVDAVFFGHTHKKHCSGIGPVIFNPGPANKGQYGVALIGEKMDFSHRIIT